MECLGVTLIILAIVAVNAVLRGSRQGASTDQSGVHGVANDVPRGLRVRCGHDSVELEQGTRVPVLAVRAQGAIVAPTDRYDARFHVRIADITENDDEPQPVFCAITEFADENGFYAFEQDTTIPYRASVLADMPLARIPVFALGFPRKGRRKLRVVLALTDQATSEHVIDADHTIIWCDNDRLGYLDLREKSLEQYKSAALLALAVSAADGYIDQREYQIIRRFFAERIVEDTDEEELKRSISNVLREPLQALRQGEEKPSQIIRRVCEKFRVGGDPIMAQVAFELCVDVVAADGTVRSREEQVLQFVAERLQLPQSYVREVRDRNLRLSMYEESDKSALVDMPRGLSETEKIEFLNREYRKWRSRVTHSDPSIAAEAALRLKRITKLRQGLTHD